MAELNLPQFSTLEVANYVPQLEALLNANLSTIAKLLAEKQQFNWDNLMQPLENMDDALEQFWSPLSHLHAVVNSPVLRECYQACLPKLSAYESAIGHNHALYNAIQTIEQSTLNAAQRKIIQDTLRDFKLSGVALPEEKKNRFEAIQTELSNLSNQFENNVLDASQAFSIYIEDEQRLAGLPEHARLTAQELAAEKGQPGWIFNLEFPSYLAVITYAEDRALREEMHKAYASRASDVGPHAGQFDNSGIMNSILALRQEKAQLLGFDDYAQLSLATKMASNSAQVLTFLHNLLQRSRAQAEQEFAQLQAFAKEHYQMDNLAPWDMAFLAEKKSHAEFAVSQEMLRPYFSLDKVMNGLFTIVRILYGVTLEEIKGMDTWHPDVKCYRLLDEENTLRGYIYVDLFARAHKRGGAWMDSLQSRRRLANGKIQLPIATLTCNFAKPSAIKKAALSHDEVITLFHEFGHCFHHVLSKVDYLNASGINGVEWDAVELPSQFFENWCWEENVIPLLTAHIDTGEPLPHSLFKQLLATKHFHSAMAMLRQLEFSLFDFQIHQEFDPNNKEFIDQILKKVRQKTAVIPVAPYSRFQHSFSHIFAGGYAAGYYSYKWAEVLSADAFSRFEEEGILNEKTGRDFLHAILEVGGAKNAAEAYINFRGREATVDALLRHNGIQ